MIVGDFASNPHAYLWRFGINGTYTPWLIARGGLGPDLRVTKPTSREDLRALLHSEAPHVADLLDKRQAYFLPKAPRLRRGLVLR